MSHEKVEGCIFLLQTLFLEENGRLMQEILMVLTITHYVIQSLTVNGTQQSLPLTVKDWIT